jgi:PIN domain
VSEYVISRPAIRDLESISSYFADVQVEAGEKFLQGFSKHCKQFASSLHKGFSRYFFGYRPDSQGIYVSLCTMILIALEMMTTTIKKLLFVDTNIWLDFYRARNDAGLALLTHAEAVGERIIVTFQLESEFKKNRQTAILEGMQELKAPSMIPRPGIFSDVKSHEILSKNLKDAEKRVKNLKTKLTRVLENPAAHDPVYQACQRIFHKSDNLVLTRQAKLRHLIRRKALRRFLHGCPPRKKNDTSIGDAFNWEWMIHCANENKAELVIVSRDSDYGVMFENKAYINDHLKQEFSERVSQKRKLLLYTRLSDALKHFEVSISKQEEDAETELLASTSLIAPLTEKGSPDLFQFFRALESVSDVAVPDAEG